jgi:hypothetical protein
MNRFPLLIVLLLLVIVANGQGQTTEQRPVDAAPDTEKLQLLSELQSLNAQSARLNSPLAQARAKAEVASAMWYLDQDEAKRILIAAYQLTLPGEAEREKRRAKAVGSDMEFPSDTERGRTEVRDRILKVAGREPAFAGQLVKLGATNLGPNEAHASSAILAAQALASGDVQAAARYIAEAIEAEPTQTMGPLLIAEVAKKDRATADSLITKYLDQLRGIPISQSQSTQRIYLVLMELIFPTTFGMMNKQTQAQPPGPAVMRAYASYIVQSLGQLAQKDPASLKRLRGLLMTAGQPIKQYAPDLMPAYSELERLTRGAGETNSIRTPEQIAESYQRERQQSLDEALDKDTIDASLIEPAVRKGLFDKARKAAESLPQGDRRTQVMDFINSQEAASLIAKGNIAGAEKLAERLRTAPRIFEVYSSLVNKCGKDQSCKTPLLYKALVQIRATESAGPVAPENVPAAAVMSKREFDTRLSTLSKLAAVAATVDDNLAREAFTEVVTAINRTTVASELGKLGFDVGLFSLYAQKDEAYAQSLAAGVTDPLRQIAAFSAIDEWKAKELKKKEATQQLLKKKTN